MDNASAIWIIVAAALAAVVLIWLVSATSVPTPVAPDTSAGPPVESQPMTPRPAPAPKPAPTP